MAVLAADLVAAYPEWEQANTSYPDVVAAALSYAHYSIDESVVGNLYESAVMLAAGAWLYEHPYSRDMRNPADSSSNPYQDHLDRILTSKGSAWRTAWSSSDFGDY